METSEIIEINATTLASVHTPVLLEECIRALTENLSAFQDPGILVDSTLGGGGHTAALFSRIKELNLINKITLHAFDQDPLAITRAEARFSEEIHRGHLKIHHERFSQAAEVLPSDVRIYGILADLGVSSDQMDSTTRGFSFRFEAPLDMRMNPDRGRPLSEQLMEWSEIEIARILFEYGEEKFSRRIARKLVELRSQGELPKTTLKLADTILRCFPHGARKPGFHPATRSFQAFRIAVNEELQEISRFLDTVTPRLYAGGRIAIISFHSLEDRIVKEFIRAHPNDLRTMTKKPIIPTDEEIERNPRSRSAKLRVAEKIRS